MSLSNLYKWKGTILDYYDSYSYELASKQKDPLQKYTVNFNFSPKTDNFVSYASILFMSKSSIPSIPSLTNKYGLTDLDIKMGIGLLRTHITSNTRRNMRLPVWSNFNKLNNGIFVGTTTPSPEKSTNCSYGNYQTSSSLSNTKTAEKIVQASSRCVNDANNRWNKPYNLHNIHKYNYKIEILDDMKTWKEYTPEQLIKNKFIPHPNRGALLKLSGTSGSATYLPVVAQDHPQWALDEYLGNLSKKAGGNYDSWREKGTKIKIYTTQTYFWNYGYQSFT